MITQLNRLMTPKSSYRRSRLAPRLNQAIVEAKVGELQGTLFPSHFKKNENNPRKRQFAAKHCEWKKKVTMNVQRLESENFLSIISPRAPANNFFLKF